MPRKKTSCCICGKVLNPNKPITEERPLTNLSDIEDWFYCLDCWYTMKSMSRRKADPEHLVAALERVLLE